MYDELTMARLTALPTATVASEDLYQRPGLLKWLSHKWVMLDSSIGSDPIETTNFYSFLHLFFYIYIQRRDIYILTTTISKQQSTVDSPFKSKWINNSHFPCSPLPGSSHYWFYCHTSSNSSVWLNLFIIPDYSLLFNTTEIIQLYGDLCAWFRQLKPFSPLRLFYFGYSSSPVIWQLDIKFR